MKKELVMSLGLALSCLACSKYDDSALYDRLAKLEQRVGAIEEKVKVANEDIKTLRSLVSASTQGKTITEVKKTDEGYDLIFSDKQVISIKHGRNGVDGYSPKISVAQDGGVYYWQLDGQWLLDTQRQKVRVSGETGPVGPQGPQGAPGKDGAVGPQGPQGPKGQDGAVGPQGPQGPKGQDGAVGPQGPQGPKGQDGAVGPQGPQGPKGQDGAVGPQGPQGPKGQDGAVGPQGPQGPKGQDGAVGPQGPQGPKGQDGAASTQGTPGQAGPQGPRGDKGETGPQGVAGQDGKTPKLRINAGKWEVSYGDNHWTEVEVVSDTGWDVFKNIRETATEVIITLKSGDTIKFNKQTSTPSIPLNSDKVISHVGGIF